MGGDTRMTVYLQPKIYRALKVKSATTDRSVSELINAAVIEALREDAVDLEAFDKRSKEPARPFDLILKDLKRDGLL
jgi:protein-tyrosine-phosphatase